MSTMITAEELLARLDTGEDLVVLDTRWVLSAPGSQDPAAGAQHDAYLAGHVPGALFVDLEADLTGPMAGEPLGADGGRHPLPSRELLTATVQRLGLSPQRPVIVYDGGNAMAAARTWWLLTDAGLTDVYVLEGGWPLWERAGGPTATGEALAVEPSTWVPEPGHNTVVDADEVTRRIAEGRRVIDVRAGERYRGETEPIDPVAGHVPGAESVPDGEIVNADGTLRTPAQVRERVGELCADDVLYCGSGVTAAHAAMVLEASGYPRLTIYPGSWSEWARQGRDVATGA